MTAALTLPESGGLAPRSAEIGELAKALALAQGEIRAAQKDRANDFFKSSYATLASVWEAVREPLSKHCLAVVQNPMNDGERVGVETTLMHASGQWMTSVLLMKPKDQTPQSFGSCLTYARRYALSAVVGIAPADDDDGEAAEGRPAQRPVPRANTVKHDRTRATQQQRDTLRGLAAKIGGLTKEQIAKDLAAFKDPDGKSIVDPAELSREQADTLMERYRNTIERQRFAAREHGGPANNLTGSREDKFKAKLAAAGMPLDELLGLFGVDNLGYLTPDQCLVAEGLVGHYGKASWEAERDAIFGGGDNG